MKKLKRRNRRYVPVLLAFTILACGGCSQSNITPSKDSDAGITSASADDIEEETMMQVIKDISGKPRPVDSVGNDEVRAYIKEKLSHYSYEVKEQSFYYTDERNLDAIRSRSVLEDYLNKAFTEKDTDKKGTNIIACKSGTETAMKLLLTAHYDSAEGSPGANDNGSGVAILLELARILDKEELPFSLEFIFFSGEEDMFVGSRYYLSQLEKSDDIQGMINIDTVAEESQDGYWVMVSDGTEYTDEDGIIDYQPVENEISKLFSSKENYGLVCMFNSDHYTFSLMGIPAVSITQDLTNGSSANTPNDNVDIVDSKRLCEVAETVLTEVLNIGIAP